MKRLISFLLVGAVLITALVLPVGAVKVDELYGDVNRDGIVDTIDATIIQRHIAKLDEIVSLEHALADFDNDKEVTILDATAIQQFSAKIIDNPRDEEYLEFFVEIDDIVIESLFGDEIIEDKAVKFLAVFDEVYDYNNAGRLKYTYTFSGITDESYKRTHISDNPDMVTWSFPSAGIYEVKIEVSRIYYPEVYSFTKRFEVLEGFKFDGKRFVDNTNVNWFYTMPKDTVDLAYETLVDVSSIHMKENYGQSSVSDDFLALVKSKAEYDKLFEIDNTYFTEEFFETKSLVISVTQGTDYYSIAPITKVAYKDNKLYVEVHDVIDSPYPEIGLPVAPLYYAFVAVDKADVENIEYIERAESRFEFVEPYNYRDDCVFFNKGNSGYVATLEKFAQYGVVEIKRVDDYSYLLMLDKHDVENVIKVVQAMQDDEELCLFRFSPVRDTSNEKLVIKQSYYSDYDSFVEMPQGAEWIDFEFLETYDSLTSPGIYFANYDGDLFAIIKTKAQYDEVLDIYNDRFSEEFFDDKYLVASVRYVSNIISLAPITDLRVLDNTLYIRADEENNQSSEPLPPIGQYYTSIAAVDKSLIENVTDIVRVK